MLWGVRVERASACIHCASRRRAVPFVRGCHSVLGHILAVVTGNIPSSWKGPVNMVQAEAICVVIADSFGSCQHAGIFWLIDVVG